MSVPDVESPIYRIRFHGRGGQGMKTASRILGTAFFVAGFEVQDAPRYGAERRGAPIFAYVRASRAIINERGIIHRPDLVVVADETLVGIPAAGVLHGVGETTVTLIYSDREPAGWQERYAPLKNVVTLPRQDEPRHGQHFVSAICAGAAARLSGVISRSCLEEAVRQELAGHGLDMVRANLSRALDAYDLMAPFSRLVIAGAGENDGLPDIPDWIELPFDPARISAPTIHAALTSEQVATGLWRTLRPVIDAKSCLRCGLCSSYCPEGAISRDAEGMPDIDYAHCKGCMICIVECPAHAIHPERETARGRE